MIIEVLGNPKKKGPLLSTLSSAQNRSSIFCVFVFQTHREAKHIGTWWYRPLPLALCWNWRSQKWIQAHHLRLLPKSPRCEARKQIPEEKKTRSSKTLENPPFPGFVSDLICGWKWWRLGILIFTSGYSLLSLFYPNVSKNVMKIQEDSFYTMPENFTWSAQAILVHTQMSFI